MYQFWTTDERWDSVIVSAVEKWPSCVCSNSAPKEEFRNMLHHSVTCSAFMLPTNAQLIFEKTLPRVHG